MVLDFWLQILHNSAQKNGKFLRILQLKSIVELRLEGSKFNELTAKSLSSIMDARLLVLSPVALD